MAFSLSFEGLLRNVYAASLEEAFRRARCITTLSAVVTVVNSDLDGTFLLQALSLTFDGIHG